ncbi:MAG: hypothetical protein E7812_17165 [Phenylobacterium sp.]|nr:MAG: hypothetical protein E7812_17165 [Phenylobacterium sp.]
MGPFEFIILFFSFIYTLALTHLLFAITRMIRHRRSLVFSWPHALWMLNALLLLCTNWISLWDFHRFDTMPLAAIAFGFVLVIGQYFVCALVTPDFEDGDSFDLRAFHEREGRTYLLTFLVLILFALVANAAALAAGVQAWANENWAVLAMTPPVILALTVRARWAQILAPLVLVALMVAVLVVYYPALTRG